MRLPTVEEINAADSELVSEFIDRTGVNVRDPEAAHELLAHTLTSPEMNDAEIAAQADGTKWLAILTNITRFQHFLIMMRMLPPIVHDQFLSGAFQLGYATGYKNGQADALDLEKAFKQD